MACSTDRFTATFVVAPSLGPPDCRDADFTDIQTAINALPSNGGKVFVKAGTYVISQTIRVQQSNVHIQGEGMGITNIVAASTMTAGPAQRANLTEQRVADPFRLGNVGKVVEHNRRRHFFENRHDLHDRGRRGADLDTPAKLIDPL